MTVVSPTESTSGPTRSDRLARGAVAALFLTNGALYANLLPRLPEVKATLGLTDSAYGLAVAAFPTGAILAGLASAVLIRRWGSGVVAAVGTILTSVGVLCAGLAPSVGLFVAAMVFGGAMDSITDVAQNAHAMRVQRRYGRSIINSFHAVWSVGAVLGGSMAAVAIARHLPLGVHLAISAGVFSIVSLVALHFCLPGRDESGDEEAIADVPEIEKAVQSGVSPRVVMIICALVLMAIAGTIVEDSGNSWATLYLKDSIGAPAAIAATGYIALVGAQFIGRLIGDRLIDRFGERMVVRIGGLITAAGMGVALAFPSVVGTVLGFAAAGFGVATMVPTAMREADELPGLKHGSGLTIVSWLMRLGFLLSPPIVGAVAGAHGLRVGLLIVPIAGLTAALLAGVLPSRSVHGGDRNRGTRE